MTELLEIFTINLFVFLLITGIIVAFISHGIFKLPRDLALRISLGICALLFLAYLYIVTDGNPYPMLAQLTNLFGARL